MKHRVALTVLLVLITIILPGATAFAGQAPSSTWGDCVAVLPGQRDDLAGAFAAMNIPYRAITSAQVKDDAFLDKLCALFLSSDSAAGRDAAPHIAQWVERGGLLYVSGSALDVLLDAFPGRLTFGGRASPGSVQVKLNDPDIAATIDRERSHAANSNRRLAHHRTRQIGYARSRVRAPGFKRCAVDRLI